MNKITIEVDDFTPATFSNLPDAIEYLADLEAQSILEERKKRTLANRLRELTEAKRRHSNSISVFQGAQKKGMSNPIGYTRNCTGVEFISVANALESIDRLDVKIAQVRQELNEILNDDGMADPTIHLSEAEVA